MRTKALYCVAAIALCLLATSCGYGSMVQTGANPWNVSMRSGVQSHYYSYSGR